MEVTSAVVLQPQRKSGAPVVIGVEHLARCPLGPRGPAKQLELSVGSGAMRAAEDSLRPRVTRAALDSEYRQAEALSVMRPFDAGDAMPGE